ncbi:MAG TPA: hypothetical protein VMX36_09060 [Sedimentisphaerales bacterium]|nr:hypothetical protein [Sedimentisphaerales bacterium]
MNTKNKIEHCLRAAPNPTAPDGLLDRLQADVSVPDINVQRSALRRWFAPTGGRISRWRVATAAAIAIAVLLPLSYGADKLIKIYHFRFESRQVSDDGTVTVTTTEVTLSGDFTDEEEARRVNRETRELKKAGKYERTFLKEIEINGVKRRIYTYRYTLSNGRVMAFNEYE